MSASPPRVSIGLPVFNGGRYLRPALDALLAQTFRDFELVIVDNASTDETEAICRHHAARDQRIRYERNPRNIGASGSFNRSLALATADLFKWAAYDDLCSPQFLERCVAVLDAEPETILAYPRTVLIDEAGDEIGPYADGMDLRQASPVARYQAYHDRFRRMALANLLYGVVRTDVLRATPGVARYANADIVLVGELALRGRFHEVPEPLFRRRFHPQMTIRAFPSVQGRSAYLDPQDARREGHPYLRMAREHLASVHRVPMSRLDRLRCDLLVARFVVRIAATWLADRMPSRSGPPGAADSTT
jgi:glycosyltransferase involved in cell wall biosynthesis